MPEKIYMTWQEFDKDIEEFITYLKRFELDNNAVILGLKRGGLPAASALSNKTGIPISLVSFQTRDGSDNVPTFLEPDMIDAEKSIIIVDDIYDSGLTVETLVDELTGNFGIPVRNITGLFHFNSDKVQKSKLHYLRTIRPNHEKWVCFPWE